MRHRSASRLILPSVLVAASACVPPGPWRRSPPPPPEPVYAETGPPPTDNFTLPPDGRVLTDSNSIAWLLRAAKRYDEARTYGRGVRDRGAARFAELARAIDLLGADTTEVGRAFGLNRMLEEGVRWRAPNLLGEAPESWEVPEAWRRTRYPVRAVRAATAIELWSLLRQEFAHRTYADEDLDAALARVLPATIAAPDSISYATALHDLLAATSDSRVTLDDPTMLARVGGGVLPFDARTIAGEMVVTRVHGSAQTSGLQAGDVIERIDDDPIVRKFDAYERLVSASNAWRRQHDLVQFFLRGPSGSSASLLVRRTNARGRAEQLTLTVTRVARESRERAPVPSAVATLSPGVVLLDAAQLDRTRVDSIRASAASAYPRALLIDVRRGINEMAWPLVRWLADQPRVPLARGRRAVAPKPDTDERLTYEWVRRDPVDSVGRYGGRVVVLIDERVDGSAEEFALALVGGLGATPIGSPSAGAVGPLASQMLPGGYVVHYPYAEIRWPDGRQLQRVGMQPMLDVRPTIAGVRAGIDEPVQAALKWVEQQLATTRRR
ncbi:MAG: S41 family peptidase [Gemmatimonadaceae bacterium]|jgi:C-terminal processing protease CtpA/Prc|nr:S41 family peptidase [Gemmatimonadaceae bacterium]